VPRNPLRETLQAGEFCHVVEIVASRISREAGLLKIASDLAMMPGVVAGGITSYAGGSAGQDPVRVGTAAKARGLTPNIHVTCVSKNRLQLREMVRTIAGLGMENIFAITGDYPKGQTPIFDMDSVELVAMINELREKEGLPLWVSVAVSPFKYTEPDTMYQYLKLEKKFAAGADWAITQLGYDARKFAEMKRYLDERGINKPVLGNVYVLGLKPAERMTTGSPPGCWVSPDLVERIREETSAKDKGEAARLERAARMVAILRGMGYAGAYLGGTHKTDHLHWIIERGKELAPQWQELVERECFPPKSAFYLYEKSTAPALPPLPFKERALNKFWHLMSPKQFPEGSLMYKVGRAIYGFIDSNPTLSKYAVRAESAIKVPAFGCQECGNCVIPDMQYVCPQTCPKQLRNGPCGGTHMSQCEVIPERPCIWVNVYERAKAANELHLLKIYVPPPDRALRGTSAWVNYFLQKDSRPGHEKEGQPGPLAAPMPPPSPPPAKKEEAKEKVAAS
jgi:methylenetetrahydrofolate reductase (NADPH)